MLPTTIALRCCEVIVPPVSNLPDIEAGTEARMLRDARSARISLTRSRLSLGGKFRLCPRRRLPLARREKTEIKSELCTCTCKWRASRKFVSQVENQSKSLVIDPRVETTRHVGEQNGIDQNACNACTFYVETFLSYRRTCFEESTATRFAGFARVSRVAPQF